MCRILILHEYDDVITMSINLYANERVLVHINFYVLNKKLINQV